MFLVLLESFGGSTALFADYTGQWKSPNEANMGQKNQTPGAQFYSFDSSPQKKLCLKFLMSKSWVFEIFVWK